MGHHHYGYSKIHKYGLFLDLFKQLSNKRSSRGSGKKIITTGNILFLIIAIFLVIFFVLTAIADLFNGLPLSNWLGTAWNYVLGVPVADLVQGGEKLLTDATRNTTPQDILTFGQVTLSSIVAIALALLDEFLGMVILAIAFIARIVNQFLRPMATLSWMLLFASLIPSAVKHL